MIQGLIYCRAHDVNYTIIPSKPIGLSHSYMEQGSCEASHITHTALPMQVNCDWDTILCHTRAG